MALALALLLAQAPLTVEQIHAEDAKVIEAALVHYYSLDKPGPGAIHVPNVTAGPATAELGIVDSVWDEKRQSVRRISVDPALRRNEQTRNAYPVSLAWFQPVNGRLRFYSWPLKTFSLDYRSRRNQWLTYVLMPGFAPDRLHAVVTFGFRWSTHHVGRATVWLTKVSGVWQVTDIGAEYLL